MDRLMVQVVFERTHLLYCVSTLFVTMNSAGPREVAVRRRVVRLQVIVNEYTKAFMIVTQQRISISITTDSQRLTRGRKWQWQNGDGLKCLRMFCQCAVVRDERNIKSQLQRDWTRITKAPSCNERHAHTLFTCIINSEAIALRDAPAGIEEGPVQIKSQKPYRHKERTR